MRDGAGSKLGWMIGPSEQVPDSLTPLFERLNDIYGPDVRQSIQASMQVAKQVGWLRNVLLAADLLAADLLAAETRPPGEPVSGLDGCFALPATEREALMAHPAVEAGSAYPTNPSSVVAARCLDVHPGQEVLDLAAAPGGKTLQLAMAMRNQGRIAAVEAVKSRFHRMRANLSRCGVTCAEFYLADGRSIGRKVPERFDRVLLDSPCSSEARIRLDEPASYAHWSPRKTREMVRKQRGLIRSAFLALKPGGEMVYCTCAFSVEENERIVDYLLHRSPEADVLPVMVPAARSLPGLTSWRGKAMDNRLSACRRVLPDELFDGFFIARIRKTTS
jgi:16S rRNA (cytosine1407-C5)-methyltransferase